MPLISVQNVTVSYEGVPAIEDVSFDIDAGEYLVIIGENGSGKSTLMKAMLGLTHVKSGKIVFGEGLDRRHIGYLPQQSAAQKDFPASVEEVVRSGLVNRMGLRMFYTAEEKRRADGAMRMLELSSVKRKSYRKLSGGQQQRALLARALTAADKVLLLDEPVTGLDPVVSAELYDIIADLNKKHGVTVIMVSHDVHAAVRDATKVLVLDGSVSFYGPAEEYTCVYCDEGRKHRA